MISAAALASVLSGCSHSQKTDTTQQTAAAADVAPGTLTIDILEGGRPEHYWQYEVQPGSGAVRIVKDATFSDPQHEDIPHTFQQPTGAIEAREKNPQSVSPDGVFTASCATTLADELSITETRTGGLLHQWKARRKIDGFAWAPNSRSVAILNKSSEIGKNPADLPALAAGHPVPHDTIFLDVLDVRNGTTTEYRLRADVIYSFTRILSWSGSTN